MHPRGSSGTGHRESIMSTYLNETDAGRRIEYDYLIVAPGIRYNYEAWFGNDRRMAEATRARFPAAALNRLKRSASMA